MVIVVLGPPIAALALAAAAYVTWVAPWLACRALRTSAAIIELDLQTDRHLRILPPSSTRVDLLAAILTAVKEHPGQWFEQLVEEPLVNRRTPLTQAQQHRLENHAERLEAALRAHGRVRVGVVKLLGDERLADRLVALPAPEIDLSETREPAKNP